MELPGCFGATVAAIVEGPLANPGEAEQRARRLRNLLGTFPVDGYPDDMDVPMTPGAGIL